MWDCVKYNISYVLYRYILLFITIMNNIIGIGYIGYTSADDELLWLFFAIPVENNFKALLLLKNNTYSVNS